MLVFRRLSLEWKQKYTWNLQQIPQDYPHAVPAQIIGTNYLAAIDRFPARLSQGTETSLFCATPLSPIYLKYLLCTLPLRASEVDIRRMNSVHQAIMSAWCSSECFWSIGGVSQSTCVGMMTRLHDLWTSTLVLSTKY